MKNRSRNIIIPYSSFIKLGKKNVSISSIRIKRSEKNKQINIAFIEHQNVMHQIDVLTITIKIYTNRKYDVLEFLEQKEKVASVYMQKNPDKDIYKDYLKAMFIK